MTAVFSSLTTGLGLTEDMKAGVVDRFRSLPIARSAVLVGRTTADLATNALTVLLMLGLGIAVGFRPTEPVYEVALALVLVLAFAYVFSWISAFIGITVRRDRPVCSASSWVGPGRCSRSSAFVPTKPMPGVLLVRRHQPGDAHRRRRRALLPSATGTFSAPR